MAEVRRHTWQAYGQVNVSRVLREAGYNAHDGINVTLSFSGPLNEVANLITDMSVSVMTSKWDIEILHPRPSDSRPSNGNVYMIHCQLNMYVGCAREADLWTSTVLGLREENRWAGLPFWCLNPGVTKSSSWMYCEVSGQ